MTPERRNNLVRLLNPRHIAFFGGRDAEVAIREAERIGYKGAIWPVNPRREFLGGYRCFASVDDLPEAPDASFMAVPAPAAIQSTARLAAMGAGGIVCYSAGFREAGADGQAMEHALVEAAGNLALVGPNCYGVINYIDRCALWPFAHGGTSPGYGAAIITQSGMLSSDITMAQRSLPLTHMISGGNQSVLRIEDFVDHLADHPAVRAIGIHIEGLHDIRAFESAALKALRQNIPVVALKSGSSKIGASLTVSHTGSLSGADDLYDALFARAGVIRVNTPSELIETLKFICVAGIPAGNRAMGFTCSGGGATMLADHAEKAGLDFPAFTPSAAKEIAGLLPDIATVSNPLDYTTPIWGDAARTAPVFSRSIALSSAHSAVLVQDYPAEGLDESKGSYLTDAGAFIAATKGIPAAICATLPENIDLSTREWLVSKGVAPMQGLAETVNALNNATNWGAARNRILAAETESLLIGAPLTLCQTLEEADGKSLVSALGLQIPEGRVACREDVISAAREIGFPVVLKMLGPKLAHKSEAGAVAVGISDDRILELALQAMLKAVAEFDPDAVTNRFLVEKLAPKPIAELIINIRRDPQFGLAMTLGSGGVFVELIGDAETLLLPVSEPDVEAAIGQLKVSRILKGYRGSKSADISALTRTLTQFAHEVVRNADDICEIEINPLFLCEDGLWAVDVLAQVPKVGQ